MAVAAVLRYATRLPVLSTYAVFSAFRSADQLRISVCYNNLHVIVGGAHAVISVGPMGPPIRPGRSCHCKDPAQHDRIVTL
jgi:transketolase